MSASRVADVEIMYSAPPQYNVQGAAINIVLRNDAQPPETPPLQGEVAAEYTQGHYPGYGIRANLFYNQTSYKIDLTVGAKHQKNGTATKWTPYTNYKRIGMIFRWTMNGSISFPTLT